MALGAGAKVAIDILLGAAEASDDIAEVIGGLFDGSADDVRERLRRAREKIHAPIDVAPLDEADREELRRILRGEAPTGSTR